MPLIDLVGPLPTTARGNKYIVTLVDYFSKWPEAEALPNRSAKSVVLFLYKMRSRYMYMDVLVYYFELFIVYFKHLVIFTGRVALKW